MTKLEWDVKLTKATNGTTDTGRYGLPMPIYRLLVEKNMWRATCELTDDGILFKPYAADREVSPRHQISSRPKWAE